MRKIIMLDNINDAGVDLQFLTPDLLFCKTPSGAVNSRVEGIAL
jgi:hypothetical protein